MAVHNHLQIYKNFLLFFFSPRNPWQSLAEPQGSADPSLGNTGFRNDPCKCSRLPPLSSVMTQQRVSRVISSSQQDEDSAEGRQSSTPADLHLVYWSRNNRVGRDRGRRWRCRR